jgi:hypothetical protein
MKETKEKLEIIKAIMLTILIIIMIIIADILFCYGLGFFKTWVIDGYLHH